MRIWRFQSSRVEDASVRGVSSRHPPKRFRSKIILSMFLRDILKPKCLLGIVGAMPKDVVRSRSMPVGEFFDVGLC